jgi:hypothetical protein
MHFGQQRMHPLLDNLNIIKAQLLQCETGGNCLDIFTLPNDMQIFSSSQFTTVTCVASTEKEMKLIQENAPTRPKAHVSNWNMRSQTGQLYLDAFLAFNIENISCVWIHLHRYPMDYSQLKSLLGKIYNRCENCATLYIVYVDENLANQHAKSKIINIDKEDNMQMQYHKQPIKLLPISVLIELCQQNGFIIKNSINGEDMLKQCFVNCLPYDLWTSQTFSLLHFQCKSHFRKFAPA